MVRGYSDYVVGRVPEISRPNSGISKPRVLHVNLVHVCHAHTNASEHNRGVKKKEKGGINVGKWVQKPMQTFIQRQAGGSSVLATPEPVNSW